jgi:hypothetical protein
MVSCVATKIAKICDVGSVLNEIILLHMCIWISGIPITADNIIKCGINLFADKVLNKFQYEKCHQSTPKSNKEKNTTSM